MGIVHVLEESALNLILPVFADTVDGKNRDPLPFHAAA
jgi:hypothetical protein